MSVQDRQLTYFRIVDPILDYKIRNAVDMYRGLMRSLRLCIHKNQEKSPSNDRCADCRVLRKLGIEDNLTYHFGKGLI